MSLSKAETKGEVAAKASEIWNGTDRRGPVGGVDHFTGRYRPHRGGAEQQPPPFPGGTSRAARGRR